MRAPPGIGFPQQNLNNGAAQSMYGMPSEGTNGASLMQPGQGQVQRASSASQIGQMANGSLQSAMSMGNGMGNARSMGLGGSSGSNAFGGYEGLGRKLRRHLRLKRITFDH